MNQEEIRIAYWSYPSKVDLPGELQTLVEAAENAASLAYAPYSGFRVGAALTLSGGETITGNNQENAAYPSGLCAERVALFYANARYPDQAVLRIAVTAYNENGQVADPVSPCGSCRQVLLETEQRFGKAIEVILSSAGKTYVFRSAADLLPNSFDSSQLNKKSSR